MRLSQPKASAPRIIIKDVMVDSTIPLQDAHCPRQLCGLFPAVRLLYQATMFFLTFKVFFYVDIYLISGEFLDAYASTCQSHGLMWLMEYSHV